jgi:(1->4)-alpha-D-glucan 1-alpha-D-glucosylmutase
LFSFGEYIPLSATGAAADHVVAFARRLESHVAITVVPRHFYRLTRVAAPVRNALPRSGPPQADWTDTRLILPADGARIWRCALSGRTMETNDGQSQQALELAEIFETLPVALLTVVSP